MSLTKLPICDEGWYANPAVNLIKNGSMGSPVIEGNETSLKGIDQRTYWTMPLYILVQAGWYKIFGATLFSMRTLSVATGLITLISWYVIVLQIGGDASLAALTLLFAAVNTTFLTLAATGRSDMLSTAFGVSAQACYLLLRSKSYKLAILAAHSLVVLSGLTHPDGGLVSLAAVLFLQIYLDRNRLALPDLLVAVTPYLVGGFSWAIYIMKSPALFLAQFGGSSADRLWPWKSPLLALRREIVERFVGAYRNGSALTPFANLRLLVLLACLTAVFAILFRRDLRRSRLATVVLAQIGLTFMILLFFEGGKQAWYLIHLVGPFAVALAASLQWHWRQRKSWRPTLAVIALSVLCLELAYPALTIVQNKYRNKYYPVIAMLGDRAKERRSVMGAAELGFGLNFEIVIDDFRLGYYSRREPQFVVFDPRYRATLESFRLERPDVYDYVQSLLARQYQPVYSNSYYTVWARHK